MKPTANFEQITPETAQQLLAKNTQNRPVSKANLAHITQDMAKGNFELTGEPIQVALDGTLLNGQHRLYGIVASGKPQEILIVRNLPNKSFKYIDTGKMRTAGDVLAIEGIHNASKMAAMIKFILLFEKGFFIQLGNKAGGGTHRLWLSNANISDFYGKNERRLIESWPYGNNKANKVLSGATLSAFHYIFNKINEIQADLFCHGLATGEDLKNSNPIYLLRQKLIADIRATRKMSRLEKIALVCKAWNHYRQNKTVSVLKWDSIKEPFPKPM